MSSYTGTDKSKVIIIVNNIPPYNKEVVNILGKPSGSTQRFRYQTKYAPTIENVNSLEDRQGTIVLRDRGNADFIPLRTIKILRSRLIGDVIHITTQLNEIACLNNSADSRSRQLKNFNDCIRSEIGQYENKEDHDLLKLVFLETGEVYNTLNKWCHSSTSDNVDYWGICVETINDRFGTEGIDFYRVVRLHDSSESPISYTSDSNKPQGFTLTPGESYSLEVIQRTYTGKKGDSSLPERRSLQLITNSESLDVQYDTKPILGKYDLITYNITLPSDADRTTSQSLLAVQSPDSDHPTPPMKINFTVDKPTKTYILEYASILFFAAFLIGLIFPAWINSFIPTDAITDDQIEKMAIIGLVVFSSVSGGLVENITDKVRI